MRRRDFIIGTSSSAIARPLEVRAQQRAVPTIGYLGGGTANGYAPYVAAFRKALGENGFIEGRNVLIEYRWADGDSTRLPALIAELVRRPVDVIVIGGSTPGVLAAKAASATIPILFSIGSDPVASKIVTTLNRPDGNATGVTNYSVGLVAKRFELLHQVVPRAINIAVLINPLNAVFAPQSKDLEEAARTLGLRVQFLSAKTENDFAPAFTSLTQQGSGALLVTDDPFFNSKREQLVALAAQHAVPTIYTYREFVIAGGLMSYAASLSDMYRQLGSYTAEVLKGEKPTNLPVMLPVKFELAINLRTAKALGLDVPLNLQASADEVIE